MKKLMASLMIAATLSGCASEGGLSDVGKVVLGVGAVALAIAGAAAKANADASNQQMQYMNQQNSNDSQVARELCLERMRVTNTVGNC